MGHKLASVAVAVALTAGIVAGEAPASAGASDIGASGVGDPFFPLAGNGGYDVRHYDLTMTWDPVKGRLDATAEIAAKATQDLDRFDVDLRGFNVSSVTVNGRQADTKRKGQELIISPARGLRRGDSMDIVVAYAGKPGPVIDPDGSSEGWMQTADGIVALGEPQGSPAWFPANDHPTDKATFELTMTVPKGWTVVSNGEPDQPHTSNGSTTFRWHEDDPMATYLATVAIGHFELQTSRTPSGLPVINAIDRSLAADSKASVRRIPEMIDWLSGIYGPYPFDSTGAIVVDAPEVGYALETQSRPVFTWAPDDLTMVHELAHQWVGDSVSLSAWPDIWLNEGFAAYTEWLWSEHDGGESADKIFRSTYRSLPKSDPIWAEPPAALPDAAELFSDSSYTRGAMTLHALRLAVGDATFFNILKTWTTTNRAGNVTTKDFIKLSEQLSGKNLKPLFNAWLYTPKKPAL